MNVDTLCAGDKNICSTLAANGIIRKFSNESLNFI